MKTIYSIVKICDGFILHDYSLDEFQSRLESMIIEDDIRPIIERQVFKAINDLEEIKFCKLEKDHYDHGLKVANYLLGEIKRFM